MPLTAWREALEDKGFGKGSQGNHSRTTGDFVPSQVPCPCECIAVLNHDAAHFAVWLQVLYGYELKLDTLFKIVAEILEMPRILAWHFDPFLKVANNFTCQSCLCFSPFSFGPQIGLSRAAGKRSMLRTGNFSLVFQASMAGKYALIGPWRRTCKEVYYQVWVMPPSVTFRRHH